MHVAQSNIQHIRRWLVGVMALILAMVAIGGVTRLTESGLSMVTWEPILGVVPPMSEDDWNFRFDQYKAFPEYQQLRPQMTIAEFKLIYFWEYLHRLVGRSLGVAYLLPLVWFWTRGGLDRSLKWTLFIGLLLGGGQGVLGWYMVKSGLADNPFVSHYRLAAHLGLAFAVIAFLFRIYMGLYPFIARETPASRPARTWIACLLVLLVVQIVWGAFVAGLNAGFFYNTFPKMQGYWIPPVWNQFEPLWRNFLDNPATVQFVHRVLGTLLVFATLGAWLTLRRDPTVDGRKRKSLSAFTVLVIAQFWLGLLTLLLMVPVVLGVLHQVNACLLLLSAVHLQYAFGGGNGLLGRSGRSEPRA